MVNKQLHFTRPLAAALAVLLLAALGGCASTPEEPPMAETPQEVVAPAPEPAAPAPVVELKANYPEKYVVVKGDTLWDIAARFLQDPWMWPHLWYFNPQVANPHLIYPGDELTIVFVDGRPVMQVTRNGRVITTSTALPPEMRGKSYPTVKLAPRIREEGLEDAIPTIPLDAIGPFLNRPRVVGEDELENAPYIMAHADKHLASGGGYSVYARGLKREELSGDYLIVRSGQVYKDPESGDVLGYEALFVGEARLTRFGDPSTLLVTSSNREVLRGDRLIPKGDEVMYYSYMPRQPDSTVDGQIIAVMDGVSMIGQYHVVVLNLGRQEGIEPGHVLAVNQAGVEVRDIVARENVTLPVERAGTVMVFRVFEKVSYALVMNAIRTMHVNDQVTNP